MIVNYWKVEILMRKRDRSNKWFIYKKTIGTPLNDVWDCSGLSMQKVSIFVDVQNIYYTTKQTFNANFDYNKFWKTVTKKRQVIGAFAYATDRGDLKQIHFQNILRGIGFEVKLKPFINRSDWSSKGDWDVGITIDIMEYASKSDVIVLASVDGDFDILMERIKTLYNSETEIYGVSNLTAISLKNSTPNFFPIGKELLLD